MSASRIARRTKLKSMPKSKGLDDVHLHEQLVAARDKLTAEWNEATADYECEYGPLHASAMTEAAHELGVLDGRRQAIGELAESLGATIQRRVMRERPTPPPKPVPRDTPSPVDP